MIYFQTKNDDFLSKRSRFFHHEIHKKHVFFVHPRNFPRDTKCVKFSYQRSIALPRRIIQCIISSAKINTFRFATFSFVGNDKHYYIYTPAYIKCKIESRQWVWGRRPRDKWHLPELLANVKLLSRADNRLA